MNNQNVQKVAELTKGTVKEIVCKKVENGVTTYLLKYTDSAFGTDLAWREVSPSTARNAIAYGYGAEKANEVMSK